MWVQQLMRAPCLALVEGSPQSPPLLLLRLLQLVYGGREDLDYCNDMWLLDVQLGQWHQVTASDWGLELPLPCMLGAPMAHGETDWPCSSQSDRCCCGSETHWPCGSETYWPCGSEL